MSDDDSNNDIDDDIAIDQSCSLSDSTRRCTIYIVDAADKMFQYQSDGKFCDFKRALKVTYCLNIYYINFNSIINFHIHLSTWCMVTRVIVIFKNRQGTTIFAEVKQ